MAPPSTTETWPDASPRTLRWQASDTDGDPLTYQLSYSSDNGLTWLPIALDLTATEYTLNPARIEGGAQVYLRVRASDGFHTASAEVGPLTVQQRPAIAPDPSPIDLGFATAGDTAGKAVALRNSGSGYLRVESIESSNTRFRPLPNALPLVIAAGETAHIPVSYSPTTVGADTATLTVRSNAVGQETFTFTIRASSVDGRQPRLETDLAALAFRPLLVGSSARATLSVLNPALVDLTASWSLQGQGFRLQGPSQATIAARAEALLTVVFEPTAAGPFNGALTLTSNDPNRPTLTIPIRGTAYTADAQPQGPRINRGGVVDAAQFLPALSPGGIASLFGSELASSVVGASTVPLPTTLNGVRVLIHGIAAPLFFVAPGQINFQVPFEVPPGITAEAVVERDGVPSPAETVSVNEFAPAVFLNAATQEPIATRYPDNAVITSANPARPGDVLILYLTGVGGLTSRPTTGQATPGSPLPESRLPATVTLGGQPVTVLYAGLSPFFIGLAQLNLQLPASLPPGASCLCSSASALLKAGPFSFPSLSMHPSPLSFRSPPPRSTSARSPSASQRSAPSPSPTLERLRSRSPPSRRPTRASPPRPASPSPSRPAPRANSSSPSSPPPPPPKPELSPSAPMTPPRRSSPSPCSALAPPR
ncbi:MAG: choice-of-anchor D domain-containing protein [Bryobacterales bacterium]|nr:choice-of-anchor D domain-containing protein [Bryobacterales bacterium]